MCCQCPSIAETQTQISPLGRPASAVRVCKQPAAQPPCATPCRHQHTLAQLLPLMPAAGCWWLLCRGCRPRTGPGGRSAGAGLQGRPAQKTTKRPSLVNTAQQPLWRLGPMSGRDGLLLSLSRLLLGTVVCGDSSYARAQLKPRSLDDVMPVALVKIVRVAAPPTRAVWGRPQLPIAAQSVQTAHSPHYAGNLL